MSTVRWQKSTCCGAFIVSAAVALSVASAFAASADPAAGENDVPRMQFNAVLGSPCGNSGRYIFGRAANGQPLACVAFDGSGTWVLSAPLHGIQRVGDSCSGDGAAQTPDGRPLMCVYGQGWQPA